MDPTGKPHQRLLFLFQVKLASQEETNSLQHVSHDDICNALEYWVNQCTLIFGDVVLAQRVQGLRDDGVDVLVQFVRSVVKIGFQVKSYGDVSLSDFTQKTKSQIFESRKHNLEHLFVFFGGDMMNPSQREKVRGLISDISQTDDYSFTIAPESVATIVNAWRNRDHPLAVSAALRDPGTTIRALAEGLSNELYEATITVSYRAREQVDESKFPYRINLKVKVDPSKRSADLANLLARSSITGETIRFEENEIEDFKVTKDGVVQNDVPPKPRFVEISPEKPRLPPVRLLVLDNEDSVRSSLDLTLVRGKVEGGRSELLVDPSTSPLQLKFELDIVSGKGSVSGTFSPVEWSPSTVLEAERFLESLRAWKRVKLLRTDTGQPVFGAEIDIGFEGLSPDWIKLLEALAFIEEKTGTKLRIPNEMTERDHYDAMDVALRIKEGRIIADGISFTIKVSREQLRQILDQHTKTGRIGGITVNLGARVTVLGRTIDLGTAHSEGLEVELAEPVDLITKRLESEADGIEVRFQSAKGTRPILVLEQFSQSNP